MCERRNIDTRPDVSRASVNGQWSVVSGQLAQVDFTLTTDHGLRIKHANWVGKEGWRTDNGPDDERKHQSLLSFPNSRLGMHLPETPVSDAAAKQEFRGPRFPNRSLGTRVGGAQ